MHFVLASAVFFFGNLHVIKLHSASSTGSGPPSPGSAIPRVRHPVDIPHWRRKRRVDTHVRVFDVLQPFGYVRKTTRESPCTSAPR